VQGIGATQRLRLCGRYAMEKLVVAALVCPPNEHVTVAVPPVPFDCMCQVQPTSPLLPTVRAEPSNERGARPVEYITLAVLA